jgi:hypothetical protein
MSKLLFILGIISGFAVGWWFIALWGWWGGSLASVGVLTILCCLLDSRRIQKDMDLAYQSEIHKSFWPYVWLLVFACLVAGGIWLWGWIGGPLATFGVIGLLSIPYIIINIRQVRNFNRMLRGIQFTLPGDPQIPAENSKSVG